MPRHEGLFPFSGNFEPQFAEALDARLRVKTKDALYDKDTWTSKDGAIYVYRYMLVAVYEDPIEENNGFYYLDNISDVTDENNWKKLYESSNYGNGIRVFKSLPEAEAKYRGCLAFIDSDSDDTLYLCIKRKGKYIWTIFNPDLFINSPTHSVLGESLLSKMTLGTSSI